MKDMFFYPLAALLIGGMIYFALSLQVDNTPDNADIFVLEGEGLSQLFPSPGTTIKLSDTLVQSEKFVLLSAHMDRDLAPPSAGVFATLGSAYEASFGGSNIKITVRARQAAASPAAAMELGYFTDGSGDSEWQKMPLTAEYENYSFNFSPLPPKGDGNDYVGIWPDAKGEGGAIEVKRVSVEKILRGN